LVTGVQTCALPIFKTVSPGTEKAPVHQDLPKGEPGQGVGSGSQVWTSKVRLDWKGVNTSERDANHTRSGTYAGASRGLGNRMGGFWTCRPHGSSASRSPSRTRSRGPGGGDPTVAQTVSAVAGRNGCASTAIRATVRAKFASTESSSAARSGCFASL